MSLEITEEMLVERATEKLLELVLPRMLAAIEKRAEGVAMVPVVEAGRLLGCGNRKQTMEFLRAERIPVIVRSRARKFVRVAVIEEWMAGKERVLPAAEPTRIERVGQPAPGSLREERDRHEARVRAAIEVIRKERKASTSLIQRSLRLTYVSADRVMKSLEQMGIVGPGVGALAREILWHTIEEVPA